MPRTLAALASIPTRAPFLSEVLPSIRPHVDRLHVYLNGYEAVPPIVAELADEHVLDSSNAGAERKLWWAATWPGVYLSCDDDIVYPPDYVPRMVDAAVRARRAFVTAHGRVFEGRPLGIHQAKMGSIGKFHKRVDIGRVVNCGGSGVMAWDATHVTVPSLWPHRNMVDIQLAAWAQEHSIPMWLIPHQAHWFRPLHLMDPNGIYRSSQREGHARRNALLVEQGKRAPWRVFPMPSMTTEVT